MIGIVVCWFRLWLRILVWVLILEIELISSHNFTLYPNITSPNKSSQTSTTSQLYCDGGHRGAHVPGQPLARGQRQAFLLLYAGLQEVHDLPGVHVRQATLAFEGLFDMIPVQAIENGRWMDDRYRDADHTLRMRILWRKAKGATDQYKWITAPRYI